MAQLRARDLPDVVRVHGKIISHAFRIEADERAVDTSKTEEIDTTGVQSKEARQKFATLDAEGSGSRRRGFKTQTEFSTGDGDKYIESPLQRLQRLKAETKQFLDDVESVAKETKAPLDQGVSAQEIAAELKSVLAQLDAQLQNERLQHVLLPGVVSKEARDSAKLSQQLAAAVQSTKSSSAAPAPSATALAVSSVGAAFNRVDYTALDARLAAIEAALGSAATPGPLLPMLRQVQSKLALLDGPTLDTLSAKVKSVNAELAAVSTKTEMPSQMQKIDELYDIAHRWDGTHASLPTVVNRLKSLRALHEEASSVAALTRSMETEQAQIKGLLQGNEAALAKLNENFTKNAATIEGNVAQLDKRMAELQARVDKLGTK